MNYDNKIESEVVKAVDTDYCPQPSASFNQGLEKLGFDQDDSLFLTNASINNPLVDFHIEKARRFQASAVFMRKLFTGSYKPQVYLFDFTQNTFCVEKETEIAHIQKRIWSSGEVPLACFFFDTEIKIVDCTTTANLLVNENKPTYIEQLKITDTANRLFNEQFAIRIKSGVFWDEFENKNNFKFSNSAYDLLIKWIQRVTEVLTKENIAIDKLVIHKIIIQSILVKYLEDKKDENNQNFFGMKYFPQFDNANSFIEVLRKGKFVELLEKLQVDFNGNVFTWEDSEKLLINNCSLSILADALEGNTHPDGQGVFEFIKLYEFNYIPVELISRLYEEFLAGSKTKGKKNKNKQEDGIFYTPSHLARLLVDESMPLKSYNDIDLDTYKVLDPACGSGIFLVLAFKRLVQWWRLKNGIDKPREVEELKKLLRCVYGTDKEEEATRLAAFSLCLALCDELSPMQIISELRFDDLTQSNILHTDFFINEFKPNKELKQFELNKQKLNKQKLDSLKFDLVIGNPPFKRGGNINYENNNWTIGKDTVQIPNKQLALKFLANSTSFLKPNGVQCLIVKSSSLLYNTTSSSYQRFLFSNLNVIQIFDFTALARNKALWDNGADVDSAAIFLRNTQPDLRKNILHVTFRRTKATNERLIFELDDYDLHYVNRETAIQNKYIWKSNLLGGGRIKATIEKLSGLDNLNDFVKKNSSTIICNEGVGGAKSLPNEAFTKNGILFDEKTIESYISSFDRLPNKRIYSTPNFLVKKNIDLPYCLNENEIKFNNEVVGFHSYNRVLLQKIANYFDINFTFLKFFAICTSGKMLVNKNTAMKKEDILNFPFSESLNINEILSKYDKKIIKDVTEYLQLFLRNGENSKAVKQISTHEITPIIEDYGNEFSSVLNLMFEDGNKKFHLSEIVTIDNSFIATIFKYDSLAGNSIIETNQTGFNLAGLTHHQISQHLSANRIIKLYPQKDTIIFIKPNQYRYWLSLIAYRDADKCFADLSKAGY